jgi:hypothetical protein
MKGRIVIELELEHTPETGSGLPDIAHTTYDLRKHIDAFVWTDKTPERNGSSPSIGQSSGWRWRRSHSCRARARRAARPASARCRSHTTEQRRPSRPACSERTRAECLGDRVATIAFLYSGRILQRLFRRRLDRADRRRRAGGSQRSRSSARPDLLSRRDASP